MEDNKIDVEKIFNHWITTSDIDLAIIFKSIDDIIDMQIELMKMRTDDDLMHVLAANH